MDVLDELLAGTRAQDGVFNLTILDLPWALEIRDEAPLAIATNMTRYLDEASDVGTVIDFVG